MDVAEDLLKPLNTWDLFCNVCLWVFLSWNFNTIAAPRLTTRLLAPFPTTTMLMFDPYLLLPEETRWQYFNWRAAPNPSWLRSCDISQMKGPEWPVDDFPVLNLALSTSDVLCDFQGCSEWHHPALQRRRDPQIRTGRVLSFTKQTSALRSKSGKSVFCCINTGLKCCRMLARDHVFS